MTKPILSVFPGIDVLGRGFEAEGYCVVRGPDTLWGGDVRTFHPTPGAFGGIIGGSPCQDFSKARRAEPTGEGLELLGHYGRVVEESGADWFVLENVPGVPDITVSGYTVQRLDVRACEFGLRQKRVRHIQFGYRFGGPLVLPRVTAQGVVTMPAALAREGTQTGRRDWTAFCALQGLPALELPGMTLAGRYRAVGNAVAFPVARAIARAVTHRSTADGFTLTGDRPCVCGCGRAVTGRQEYALPACRKRQQRRRDSAAA